MFRTRAYVFYAVTIFLSAFLLFAIQPISGKHLLPYFGGASSVWATSLLFFTGALFVGYAYVYFLCKQTISAQTKIHLGVVAIGALALVASYGVAGGLYPSFEWVIGSASPPALLTLFALAVSIGIPYFVLATTGPLLQYWYGISAQKEPYKLYAMSNAGSFIALLSYPFIIEPIIDLRTQDGIWAVLFCGYAILCCVVAMRVRKIASANVPQAHSRTVVAVTSREKLTWIFYAAFPSLLLVATTTEITQTIAAIPLLWIVPLSIYLLTFIIAFSGFRVLERARGLVLPILLFGASIGAWWFLHAEISEIKWKIFASLVLLFFVGLACHCELYRRRPEQSSLPLFYLLLSFGGMLGALLASIVAPLAFNDYFEFPMSVAIAAILAVYLVAKDAERGFARGAIQILSYALIGLIAALIYTDTTTYANDYALAVRNFYGTAKVQEDDSYITLMNGGTMHGFQSKDPAYAFVPSSYYVEESGLGRAITDVRARHKNHSLAIGILGLGSGSIAAYCKKGDTYVFYEIDPKILEIAHNQFSYLAHCPQASVRLGDGRILLEKERREGNPGKYDIMVMDAFNDDTIPIHLLTREAFETYLPHLKNDHSIIAVHISNRYLDLQPPLLRVAGELGLWYLHVNTDSDNPLASGSSWVLLSKGADTFTSAAFKDVRGSPAEMAARTWTDDYSDILSVLDL